MDNTDNIFQLKEYEKLLCNEINKIRKDKIKWNKNEYIDISFLDKKTIINLFYNAFRYKKIDIILKNISDYCVITNDIKSKLLETNLTDEDLENLANTNEIKKFKNIYLNIKFTENGELIFNEDYNRDYVTLLFSYLDNHEYFKSDDFQYSLQFIYYLNEKHLALDDKINKLRKENEMLPEEEKEKKKREQWIIEEEKFKIEIIVYMKKKQLIKLLSEKMKYNKNNKLCLKIT